MRSLFPTHVGVIPIAIKLQMLVGTVTGGGSTEAPFFFERRMDMPANKINDGSIVLIGKAMQQG